MAKEVDPDTQEFRDTVSKVSEEYGVKGFTAQKTAAGRLLGDEISTLRGKEGAESIAVAGVLDNLEIAQKGLESSRDPQETKEILKTVKDLKQVVKNLNKASSPGGQIEENPLYDELNDLIKKTEKNVKKVGKAGGAFGKANETFLGSLTETLNPLSGLGNFFGTAGMAPLEGYFNSLGDSLNEKVKGALGIGASEESMNITRDIQKDQQAEIDTADQEQANLDQSVLTKEGETSKKGVEEGEGSFTAEDLLLPSLSLVPRTKKRLAHALGLTDASGKPFLGLLVDYMKPDPSSRGEGGDDGGGLALLGKADDMPEIEKPKGIISRILGFVGKFGLAIGTFLGSIGAFLKNLPKLAWGLIKKMGVGIVARIGLRGALAGTLAGIPVVGWVAALVIQGLFGIFDGIMNILKVSKDPSATIGDKIWAFFDGFLSGFFTFGLVSPEKIKEFRGKIKDGFWDMLEGIGSAVTGVVSGAVEMVKNIGSGIKDFGAKMKDAAAEFLKSSLRAILPTGDTYMGSLAAYAIPEKVYTYAGLDKETGERLPEPEVPEVEPPEMAPRAELTSSMRTAMSDMGVVAAQKEAAASVALANQNNINNVQQNYTTVSNSSPQDKDFDYYATYQGAHGL